MIKKHQTDSTVLDRVRELVDQIAGQKKRSLRSLSLACGVNPGYLHQFVEQGTPRRLPEDVREKLAAELRVSPQVFRPETTDMQSGVYPEIPIVYENTDISSRDLPVYAMEIREDGVQTVDMNNPIEHTERPARLATVQRAYGVVVSDDTMAPRYLPGETVHIHPGRPVTSSDFALLRLKDGTAMIRRIDKLNEKTMTVSQLNPPKETRIARTKVESAHRIVGTVSE